MVKKRKAELYEMLANKATPRAGGMDNPAIYSEPKQLQNFARNRNGREIVFSLDGAFVIFVVVLLLIGTAFFLGYRKGSSEVRASFVSNVKPEITENADDLKLVEANTPPEGVIEIPQDKYSLRLVSLKRTAGNYKALVELRRKLLGNSLISGSRLQVFIFDKGKGGVYSLAVGLFSKPEDEMIATLRDFFNKYSLDGKNREFKNITLERADDLGAAQADL